MNVLLVCPPAFSEMSPDAPGRIAYVGRKASPMYPELMYNSPCRANGVGTEIVDMPGKLPEQLRRPDRTTGPGRCPT